jgi:fatty-acyl-CoA synthase
MFCRNQIAYYKVPRYIRFVEEMPMTVTGKAQKFVMRERMTEELQLNETKDHLGIDTQNPGRLR